MKQNRIDDPGRYYHDMPPTPTKDEMLDMVNSAAEALKRGDPLVAPPGYTLREGTDGRLYYLPTMPEDRIEEATGKVQGTELTEGEGGATG